MDKSMAKPVKIAVGIYLALVLLACSSYLIFILIGSLQGNDMSHSVLDTDPRYINNRSQSSNETINKNESPHSTSNFTEIKKKMLYLHIKILLIFNIKKQILTLENNTS